MNHGKTVSDVAAAPAIESDTGTWRPASAPVRPSILSFAWKGLRTSLELGTVLVPTYAVVQLLKAYGAVDVLNHCLTPVVQFVGLRGELSVPLLAGYLGNVYFALGAAAALPLSAKEATILAVMLGLCHSLPEDTFLFMRLGANGPILATVRVAAALLLTLVLGRSAMLMARKKSESAES